MLKFRFDDQLLNHIEFGRNTEAKSILNEELARKADEFGTLLHRAAYYDNVEIVEHLIKLGNDVNFSGADGKTALMIAVEKERLQSVKVLLDASANVDAVDAKGRSALQMVFHSDYGNTAIIEALVQKLRASTRDFYVLTFKLLQYGYALHHAIILRDLHLIKFMVECDLKLDSECSCLEENSCPAVQEEPTIIIIFLELQNDPNIKRPKSACNLNIRIDKLSEEAGRYGLHQLHEIDDMLIRGDDSFNWQQQYYVEDSFLFQRILNRFNSLIAHLVMLEKCGTPMLRSAKCYKTVWSFGTWTKIEKYHELCRRILDTIMFGTSTLFDLLNNKHNKIKGYVGNKTFATRIGEACSKHRLRDEFSYYFKMLKIRISRANQINQLEDTAIAVISKIFNSNYNECYNFARKVIGYLNREELERLCMLYN